MGENVRRAAAALHLRQTSQAQKRDGNKESLHEREREERIWSRVFSLHDFCHNDVQNMEGIKHKFEEYPAALQISFCAHFVKRRLRNKNRNDSAAQSLPWEYKLKLSGSVSL